MNKGKNVAKKKGLLLFVVLLNLVSSVIKSFKLLEHTSIHSKGSFTMRMEMEPSTISWAPHLLMNTYGNVDFPSVTDEKLCKYM